MTGKGQDLGSIAALSGLAFHVRNNRNNLQDQQQIEEPAYRIYLEKISIWATQPRIMLLSGLICNLRDLESPSEGSHESHFVDALKVNNPQFP